MGRLAALFIVLGSVLTQGLPQLPSFKLLCAACLGLALVLSVGFTRRRRWLWRLTLLFMAFMLSVSWATWRAEQRLSDALWIAHENVVSRLTFRVTSLPNDSAGSLRFEAQVLEPATAGVPSFLQVSWLKSSGMPCVLPGQTFRAALVLRRPHTLLNPHGFDHEGHLFAKNIRALARVRGKPVLLADAPFASFSVSVARARHHIRAAMRRVTADLRYGAVLIALAIGDQDSVRQEHWQIFNLTGITHLVSISGSHVTMLAAVGGWLTLLIMKRTRWRGRLLCERIPARVTATLVAMLVAWLYCLLAGWGVPAQRTFFMLACVAVSILVRHTLSASRVLAAAAAILVLADPWAPLATGFWLSFLAVGILFAAGAAGGARRKVPSAAQHAKQLCAEAGRLQWLITIAMLPVLAFLFQQVSLVSPFANALAIPVLTFVVTPLALALAVFGIVPGLGWLATASGVLAHSALEYTLIPVTWLANLSWASFAVAAAPFWTLVLAGAGLSWALQPPGWPMRWAGWCLLGPVLSFEPARPAWGDWRLLVFDVGQGGAVLLQTQTHDILFDMGPRQGASDAGARTIVPGLRALGVRRLESLVVSHSDSDHAGGLLAVLKAFPVGTLYSSFSFQDWLRHAPPEGASPSLKTESLQTRRCERGQNWDWDGVRFEFLHPPARQLAAVSAPAAQHTKTRSSKNAQSCVLHVQGSHHSALLPGDIGVKQEALLLERHITALTADLVVVAHHGSDTSSSPRFVQQIGAQHAIVQAGYLNRFGHPHPAIKQRWLEAEAKFWQTDRQGAIAANSTIGGLSVQTYAQLRQRYWHQRFP